jgi:excisionase family DNA binding protein
MTQSEKKQPKLLTLKQASEMLNCHPNTLRKWDTKGYLVAVRFGTRRDTL